MLPPSSDDTDLQPAGRELEFQEFASWSRAGRRYQSSGGRDYRGDRHGPKKALTVVLRSGVHPCVQPPSARTAWLALPAWLFVASPFTSDLVILGLKG